MSKAHIADVGVPGLLPGTVDTYVIEVRQAENVYQYTNISVEDRTCPQCGTENLALHRIEFRDLKGSVEIGHLAVCSKCYPEHWVFKSTVPKNGAVV